MNYIVRFNFSYDLLGEIEIGEYFCFVDEMNKVYRSVSIDGEEKDLCFIPIIDIKSGLITYVDCSLNVIRLEMSYVNENDEIVFVPK